MKIHKLIIENFRAYSQRTEIDFDDLTVLVGKNDVGKSSILEALDIFFENSKPDKNDRNISSSGNVKIGVIFSSIPTDFLIDTKVKTSLQDEFLLNTDGFLEIYKEFKTKVEISIRSNYPKNKELQNLINLKIDELKELTGKLSISVEKIDKRVSSELRKVIREALITDETEYEEIIIKLDTENEAKNVWKKIQEQLPFFALFKADRATSDKDKEVQDPMKLATKQALQGLLTKLEEIQTEVKNHVKNLADKTIEKLKEMDSEIASSLETIFEETKWEKAFDIRLESDKVPLDKKGSGLRRLVLINFFRAEADRKMQEKSLPNIIYAIEEPETSQHPDWQVKLIEALKDLSELDNTQVMLTTHSPALANMINPENIRFVKKQTNGVISVEKGSEINLEEIANTLGILPNIPDGIDKLRLVIYVEGFTDIHFFTNSLRLFGIDLETDNRVVIIFAGGATLEHWIKNNYLKKLAKPELHIYDNDVAKYQAFIEGVNERQDGSIGLLTNMREVENYIHPQIIKELYELESDVTDLTNPNWLDDWRTKDIPTEISNILKAANIRNSNSGNVKKKLTIEGSAKMTKQLFDELQASQEIESWISQIKQRIE